jgi:hypothetical protein
MMPKPKAPKAVLGILYDSGALIAADRGDRRMWAIHQRALQRGVRPVVPAGCVVEAWRGGRQPNLARLLDGCEVEVLDEARGKRAGVLRAGAAEPDGRRGLRSARHGCRDVGPARHRKPGHRGQTTGVNHRCLKMRCESRNIEITDALLAVPPVQRTGLHLRRVATCQRQWVRTMAATFAGTTRLSANARKDRFHRDRSRWCDPISLGFPGTANAGLLKPDWPQRSRRRHRRGIAGPRCTTPSPRAQLGATAKCQRAYGRATRRHGRSHRPRHS